LRLVFLRDHGKENWEISVRNWRREQEIQSRGEEDVGDEFPQRCRKRGQKKAVKKKGEGVRALLIIKKSSWPHWN